MASDLISWEKAKEEILAWARCITNPKILSTEDTMTVLDMMEGDDAVEVVRCEKCVYRGQYLACPMFFYSEETRQARDFTKDNGFCHRGVKKDAVD